ncbi:MAG: patatin-like phospholipase family protein [Xanthobacteraceae bacterium]
MLNRTVPSVGTTDGGMERPPFECIALVLQGGGALGAYQAGVYEALAEAHLHPDWIAGISIGAINAALIAGNRPEDRVGQLRAFWSEVTASPVPNLFALTPKWFHSGPGRTFVNELNAAQALAIGAPGFFAPRTPAPYLHPPGTAAATSFYDTSMLRATLERLVDFDRINSGEMRLSVGAVNVGTGNFTFFDTRTHKITPEHVLASGALPPGFPAVEIEGEPYWDGGLVSNTPLEWVVSSDTRQDTLVFQVDLWSARGPAPISLSDVFVRQKEIQYSSRTRAATDQFKKMQNVRGALANLLKKLPPELLAGKDAEILRPIADHKVYSIVQLIYRSKHYEGQSKDYEFSRSSMLDHWKAGHHDAICTLRHPQALQRPSDGTGVATFDLGADGRAPSEPVRKVRP